jgi:hypothetical protein
MQARSVLERFQFKYRDGHRYVGGFIGTGESHTKWLEPQIQRWVKGVESLAMAAKRYPQTAYAGMGKSLQMEWQYLQRVTPTDAETFQPIEAAIRDSFLPALLGEEDRPPDEKRQLYGLSVKSAGLGVPNPVDTATTSHSASVDCTRALSSSLCDNVCLDVKAYRASVSSARKSTTKDRKDEAKATLERLLVDASRLESRRIRRSCETGAWLTAMPDRLNGTELSALEFRDSLRLRCGLAPTDLPQKCDGCQQPFTVEHAVSCKKGGLVLLRHNDVKAEWHELCARAHTPSAVSDEPLIHLGQAPRTNATATAEVLPELRGDVAVKGFWKRGATTIFDVRITDTDAPSYRQQDVRKILEKHEKEKKKRYLQPCIEQRRHFTPLVFSVDGMMGSEAAAAAKCLASTLSTKWKRQYSEVCGFVRSRLSVALVRSMSMCLRNARDPTIRCSRATWDTGSGLGLYRQ